MKKISTNSPVTIFGTKSVLNYSRDHPVRKGLEQIASHNADAFMTDDLPSAFAASFGGGEKPEFDKSFPHAKL